MIENHLSDAEKFFAVMMATPELAEYSANYAASSGLSILDTLSLCAKATIPMGHRVGFMSSALSYLWDKRATFVISIPNPEAVRFFETGDGEVFWRDIT